MNGGQPILEARGIVRAYPGVTALKGVDLTLVGGQVMALVGENGAGKSTLIRIIGGLESPTSGRILVRGEQVEFDSAHDSQAAAISVVSQEFRLVPQLTVAENVFLGHEPTRFGVVSRRQARARTRELLEELGLDIDPERQVQSLTVGDQQLVEITRSLSRDFDLLVMDEPSAALNGSEVDRLLDLVRRLRAQGKAILYVSHRLEEIFAVADRITVFRDGERVAELQTSDTDQERLVELMLGRTLEQRVAEGVGHQPMADGVPRIELSALQCPRVAEPLDLAVRPGEVVGLAGLVGSGRTEIMRTLFGVTPARGGTITVDGRVRTVGSPADAIAAGMFMLSEDRKADGILPHLDVLENLVVSARRPVRSKRAAWVPDARAEHSAFARLKDELHIRVDQPGRLIGNLSGGNQQKVLFGRAVLSGARVLLLNEATRGVDVGAKVEIYALVRRLAEEGVAVIVSSSEAAELVIMTDRCLVLYAGRVRADLVGSHLTEDNIVAASVGQNAGEVAS